jgi:hypothetical protein
MQLHEHEWIYLATLPSTLNEQNTMILAYFLHLQASRQPQTKQGYGPMIPPETERVGQRPYVTYVPSQLDNVTRIRNSNLNSHWMLAMYVQRLPHC